MDRRSRRQRRAAGITSARYPGAVSAGRRNSLWLCRPEEGLVRKGRSPHANRLSHADRLEILERVSRGEGWLKVAGAVGCGRSTLHRVLVAAGGTPSRRSRRRPRSALRLSLVEREEIRAGIAAGESFRAIARRLGRAPSTVSREVGGVEGRGRYRATRADDRACLAARRPKVSKLARSRRLRRAVVGMLEQRFSPQQISARLRREFPDDPEMRIAPETIYQSLYVQSRGALRKDLTRYLRSARAKRKPRRPPTGQGRIPAMVSISERPPEVADRAVPGHWEGDLLVGRQGRSFIGTLVERHTRYVMLIELGRDARTETVTARLAEQIVRLPEQLRLSLTWDQGREMARHQAFTVATGVQVYFCDPHSPWQRGSNENTNGLLRQYFPKGTDLALHDQAELDRVAAELNRRPRQTLDWHTPAEKMTELLR
jgi:transposase, IS30 family